MQKVSEMQRTGVHKPAYILKKLKNGATFQKKDYERYGLSLSDEDLKKSNSKLAKTVQFQNPDINKDLPAQQPEPQKKVQRRIVMLRKNDQKDEKQYPEDKDDSNKKMAARRQRLIELVSNQK